MKKKRVNLDYENLDNFIVADALNNFFNEKNRKRIFSISLTIDTDSLFNYLIIYRYCNKHNINIKYLFFSYLLNKISKTTYFKIEYIENNKYQLLYDLFLVKLSYSEKIIKFSYSSTLKINDIYYKNSVGFSELDDNNDIKRRLNNIRKSTFQSIRTVVNFIVKKYSKEF